MEDYTPEQAEEISRMMQIYACYHTLRSLDRSLENLTGKSDGRSVQQARGFYEEMTPLSIRMHVDRDDGLDVFRRKLEALTKKGLEDATTPESTTESHE